MRKLTNVHGALTGWMAKRLLFHGSYHLGYDRLEFQKAHRVLKTKKLGQLPASQRDFSAPTAEALVSEKMKSQKKQIIMEAKISQEGLSCRYEKFGQKKQRPRHLMKRACLSEDQKSHVPLEPSFWEVQARSLFLNKCRHTKESFNSTHIIAATLPTRKTWSHQLVQGTKAMWIAVQQAALMVTLLQRLC